jgi:hypothetical protein
MATNSPVPLPGDSLLEWRQRYPNAANDLVSIVNRLYALNLRLVAPGTVATDQVLLQNPDQFTLALPIKSPNGYGTPTGTLTRTTFATSTVTTAQLAERVAALISDLQTTKILPTT